VLTHFNNGNTYVRTSFTPTAKVDVVATLDNEYFVITEYNTYYIIQAS
jgi:hypothetical protein